MPASNTLPSHSRSPSPASENDVFAISTTLVPLRNPKPAGTTSLSFNNLLTSPLLLHEDLQSGCGGQLWPAGMLLATYLLTHHRSTLRNKHVLEIGAGGGLVGLGVALGCDLGPGMEMVITDQDVMLALMRKNIALNNLEGQVRAEVYDWGTSPPDCLTSSWTQTGQSSHPDVVLAADCVYFEPAFPLLLETLADLIGPATVCYFCFKKRRKADMRFIRDMLKKFDVEEVDWEGRESGRREGIWLYAVRVRRKCG